MNVGSLFENCFLFAGKVYNISPYLEYHPGGEEELMKGAGIDGTRLFDEVIVVIKQPVCQQCGAVWFRVFLLPYHCTALNLTLCTFLCDTYFQINYIM